MKVTISSCNKIYISFYKAHLNTTYGFFFKRTFESLIFSWKDVMCSSLDADFCDLPIILNFSSAWKPISWLEIWNLQLSLSYGQNKFFLLGLDEHWLDSHVVAGEF